MVVVMVRMVVRWWRAYDRYRPAIGRLIRPTLAPMPINRRSMWEKERLVELFGKGKRAAEVFVRFELPKPVASVDLGSEIRRKIAEATMAGRLGKRVIHFANLPIKLLIPSSFTDITEIALKTIPSASKIEIKRVLESLYGFQEEKRAVNKRSKTKHCGRGREEEDPLAPLRRPRSLQF
ncbi:hypothetical protein Dimus_035579 [Dionaea muscipula]